MKTSARDPLLAMHGVVKSFGGAQALRGVDFDLERGQVHALLGENGAGKSTLMNVLSGVIEPDHGEILIDGSAVRFADPRAAQAAGVATIFQELDLVPSLDVTANLFLGRELTRAGVLDRGAMRRAARARLDAIGFDVDVDQPVGELSVGRRQIVAIAKALTYASRILVMDEPTAALTAAEVQRLFHVMRDIARRGVGIVYISHRLEEVPRVADRVTVLRDGRIAGTAPPTAPQSDLVSLLVGRALTELYPRRSGASGRRVLRLERAAYCPRQNRAGWRAPRDVSLEVRAGEVVGLAGIMGAGRTELLSTLYGAGGPGAWSGLVEVEDRLAKLASVPEAPRQVALERLVDDEPEPARRVRTRRCEGLLERLRRLHEEAERRVAHEGRAAGEALVEDRSEREDVGGRRDGPPGTASGRLPDRRAELVAAVRAVCGPGRESAAGRLALRDARGALRGAHRAREAGIHRSDRRRH